MQSTQLHLLLSSFALFFSGLLNAQSFSVSAFSLPHAICDSEDTGGAKVIALNGLPPYTYLWDDGHTLPVHLSLSTGPHQITVTDASGLQQIASVEVAAANSLPLLEFSTSDTFLCQGESTFLEITTPLIGNPQWSTGDTTVMIPIQPDVSTTYLANASVRGANLLLNGDFEFGDQLLFTDYLPGMNGPFGPLSDAGTYAVTDNPQSVHINFIACSDHTTGMGQMMVFNGSNQPATKLWCETVPVQPMQPYQFSAWVTMVNTSNPPSLALTVNDEPIGESITASLQSCDWQELQIPWSDPLVTEATICLLNTNTIGGGNDFAIDDLFFGPICEATDSVEVQVSDLEAATSVTLLPNCIDELGSVVATPAGGLPPYSFDWSTGAQTASLEELPPGPYRVTVTDANGCIALQNVIVPPAALPEAAIVVEPTTCGVDNGLLRFLPDAGAAPFLFSINGGMDFSQDPLFKDLPPGSYEAVLQDADGCEATFTLEVAGSSPIEVAISAPLGLEICEIKELELEAGPYVLYRWSTGDSTSRITVTEPGMYSVFVEDANRCEGTDTVQVVFCDRYEIPNIFTPNGDQVNDSFGVLSGGGVQVLEMQIFNQWGNLVYSGTDPWDGQVNGQPHPGGVFGYSVLLKVRDGDIQLVSGELTLLR